MKPPTEKKRYYSFACVTYALEGLENRLQKECKKWAYIVHDKDEQIKHAHVICTFTQNKTFKQVSTLLSGETGQNTLAQDIKDIEAIFDYLTHTNGFDEDGKKHVYDKTEIKSNDIEYWKSRAKLDEGHGDTEKNEKFIDDLMHMTSVKQMCIQYGRDFMKNIKSYMYIRDLIAQEECGKALNALYYDELATNIYRVRVNMTVANRTISFYLMPGGELIGSDDVDIANVPGYELSHANELSRNVIKAHTSENCRVKTELILVKQIGEFN